MMWFLVASPNFINAKGYEAPKYQKVEPVLPKRSTVKAPRILGGGPDGYGYTYLSTQDGDAVTFNFIDISSTGTPVGAGDDWCSGSNASTLYYLGFTFPFYDKTTDSISICSNGTVVFNNKYDYLGFSNTSLPSNSYGEHGFVAVMWDDLNPAASGADDIYFQSFSTCPDGYSGACAVVQWNDVPIYGRAIFMTFQVIIYDNGNIKLQYNSTIDYGDATIGIQDSTAAAGTNPTWYLQYVYNGSPSGHIPDSGTAILFQPPTPIDYDLRVVDITPLGSVDVAPISIVATVRNNGNVNTTNSPIYLFVYDTTTSTLVFADTQLASIPALTSNNITFDPFTPSPRSFYRAVVIAGEPMDTVHDNDTLSGILRTYYIFGDILGIWTFPSLGDGSGYSFAGITYAPDSGKFYVITMNPPSRVFKFDPTNPSGTFSMVTTWTLRPFFGTYDIPWGIAYVNGKFWVSHVGFDGSSFIGNKMGIYDGNGNLIDSFDIWANIESGWWMAGMDYDRVDNVVLGVYVGGSNNIYKIDPITYTSTGTIPNHTGISLRGISSFPEADRIYYGGWNQNMIYSIIRSSLAVNDSADMVNMADVDVWNYCPDSTAPIFAFITINDPSNTLVKMATGFYCDQLGVSESVMSSRFEGIEVFGRTITFNGSGVIYDITGRKVAEFNKKYTFRKGGIYFVKAGDRVLKVIIR
ncbi:MAG: hypothetical protein ABIL53_05530 [candidate division WOR-3 bacterium]